MSGTARALQVDNRLVADKLETVAELLDRQKANPFRIRAYRDAATYLTTLPQPVSAVLAKGGARALEALPTIGPSIAAAIVEILQTGDLRMLQTLRGDLDPEKLFQVIPTIGPALAAAIHENLGIDTLEALEAAALDGRLATVAGFGPRRVRSVLYALDGLLARRRMLGAGADQLPPPVPKVLDIDREYRMRAQGGLLPMIAPKRFNPSKIAWLPILHAQRGDWHFTATFSNTQRAHQLGRTDDWVVIRYDKDSAAVGQCTVVTEQRGPLAGKRVVRGHEAASAAYHAGSIR
ncbi:helix-hairpin-helix domain-containing protein [Yoonia sp.]|uniref:helix-hairpin-helix domain-containing protein n=1 Tax=Yoonia sp. TaxID=2212373 RepID=UPI0019DC994D|nr:helix-hairpin-helix domain-containing protein [Yoonia sp.]MBE0412734.1 DNA-binding protein [Yoonia sp.]